MKRILLLSITVMLSLFFTTSCGFWQGDDSGEEASHTFYGVVVEERYEDIDFATIYVFIPGTGAVALPSLEGGEAPQISSGNLVRLYFENVGEMYLLESYPAMFGIAATEIGVKDTDVSLEYKDGVYYYTSPCQEASDFTVGDEVEYESIQSSEIRYRGTVTEISDERITVVLSLVDAQAAQNFLSLQMNGANLIKANK